MTVGEIPAGDEFTEDNAFIPSSYAAHAVMLSGVDETQPAMPGVLLDLEGYFQAELPTTEAPSHHLRVILEPQVAQGIIDGFTKSLVLLDNIRRNQEGPQ